MSDRTINESTYRQVHDALHNVISQLRAFIGPDDELGQAIIADGRAALATLQGLSPAQATLTPEVTAEQYIAQMIDRGPEPLRRLADWLSLHLDEDDWKTAERMLLGAYEAAAPAQATLTDAEIEALAHRKAWHYVHNDANPNDSRHAHYTFNRDTLLSFAFALFATPPLAPSVVAGEATDDLPRLVHEAMGAASMCWEFPERAGVFQASKASELAWQLIRDIRGTPPAAAGAAVQGWQPIETAPKDAYVLLWSEFAVGDPLVVQGCWTHAEGGCWVDWDANIVNATHWMPLPALPSGD